MTYCALRGLKLLYLILKQKLLPQILIGMRPLQLALLIIFVYLQLLFHLETLEMRFSKRIQITVFMWLDKYKCNFQTMLCNEFFR